MNNVSVLIIEDTPAESEALVQVLTENNYTIAGVARTFSEALALFYQQTVSYTHLTLPTKA